MFQLKSTKRNSIKRIISVLMIVMLMVTGLHLEGFNFEAKADQLNTTIYLIDNTSNNWVGNDNAVIELVDNTNGHIHYTMSPLQ